MIKDWISQIRTKTLALPEFQRYEAWGPTIVTALLTSIVKGLPVGVCLILEVGIKPQFRYRFLGNVVQGSENRSVRELLLDGQQRLTALWRSFTDDYDDKTFLLDLEPQEDETISAIAVTRWYRKDGQKYPLWVDDPKECWVRKKIPFRILNPDNESEYFEWADKASQDDLTKRDQLLKQIIKRRNEVATCNIPYLCLPAETPPEVAIDVFVKLNTSYVRLTAFDIIVAQVQEATEESLHQRVKDLEKEVPEIREYTEASDFVLAVAALLQDKIANQKGFFTLDLERVISDWSKITRGTKELIEFLEEQKVYDRETLPTETILPPIAAVFAELPESPDARGNVKLLMKKFLWRAFFTERYDRTTATRILADYKELRKLTKNEPDYKGAPIFDDAQFPIPNTEILKAAGWPKKKDRLARAILLLSLRKGAVDFADASHINRKNIRFREYHHLYPDAFLKSRGISDTESFKALNCALITWKTNRMISDKEPLRYLLERANASLLGENEIRFRLSTHLVDYDALKAGDYNKFLDTRAKDAKFILERLCDGLE